jgi:glutamate/tyrosine decarboxylase-like PLP-dependent enzyme
MRLPARGRTPAEVLDALEDLRGGDVDWRAGRAFTLAYVAGPEVLELGREAYARFSSENALNVDAFPSLRKLQADVVSMVADLVHGGAEAAGFLTSGGTESLLMAVLAARERARAERGVSAPEVVLPTSAHAAFEKAAHYFGVRSVRVPVRSDWRADPAAMADAVGPNTVLLVASAPQYPQGVIDPVADVAAIAERAGVPCHVDACMGGMLLPFLERLGEPVPVWDFRVPGVTSISVDLHKYGYTAKGASVIVHRTRALRRYQTFQTDNWLGGAYASSGVLGTKSGGAIAAAWAVLHHVGEEGYLRLVRSARESCLRLAAGIRALPGAGLLAEPDATLLAFRFEDADAFAVGEALWKRGWYVDRQAPPPSLHATVNAVHAPVVDRFLGDLAAAAAEVRSAAARGERGAYGTLE